MTYLISVFSVYTKLETLSVGVDSLLLVFLAKMRSSVYADFHEGQPTLVNIVGVNA